MRFRILAMAVTALACAQPVHANLSIDLSYPGDFPGWKVYEVFWDGGGGQDWTSAGMLVELTQGDVYNDSQLPAGDIRPAIWPPIIGSPYDTWVGPDDVGVVGGCSDCGGGPSANFDGPIDVTWFNTSTADTGLVKIAQFTLSTDAFGTYIIISQGQTLSGVIIPEPASLALLALAGTALLRRRSI